MLFSRRHVWLWARTAEVEKTQRNPRTPLIIFLSGRKRPQVSKHDFEAQGCTVMEKDDQEESGCRFITRSLPKRTIVYSCELFAAKAAPGSTPVPLWRRPGLIPAP